MKTFPRVLASVAALAALAVASLASAGSFGGNPATDGGWSPRVPVSSLARPMAGLDLTRLHMSTTLSFGTGFGGTSEGLQTTRLSYQFSSPFAMSVSVGNTFGPASTGRGGNGFFLQGLDLSYRPSANTLFAVHYQNLRSPLQYNTFGYGPEYFGSH